MDNLYNGPEVREKLIKGIKKISSAVGGTMGTGGSNAIIEAIESPGHFLTNDGYSIANAIKLADPIENIGKNILLESINRANKSSGDGSSTTCVLTAKIIEEGMKYISEVSPMEIKRSLEECVPKIETSIETNKREITVDDVHQIATISAEDKSIGDLIGEIYKKIGPKGIIHWDISRTPTDSYTIGSGLTIEGAGYVSPYLCDMDEKTGQFLASSKWKNPVVLITKQKISSPDDLNGLLATLYSKDIKELVIFCDEIEAVMVSGFVQTRIAKGFKTMVIKMPVLWKDQWYEDLAKASGATVIDPARGVSFKTMKVEHLGKFGNIIVTKDTTFVDGINDMSEYIKALEEEGSDDSLVRVARLNTKTARYFVGASSDSALSYRRLKVEDAIGASWNALKGGIVAGGGSALVMASDSLSFDTVGEKILREALLYPAKQIAINAGYPDMNIGLNYRFGKGFDSKTKQFVNMFDAGICDPAIIVLNAVRNAISVSAAVLTANTLVTYPREETKNGL